MPPIEPRLTSNQEKVIRDKYLRDDPSPAAWLERVAGNVALAEVLLDPRAASWGVFTGVSFREERGMRLLHPGLDGEEARHANFSRLLANAESACRRVPEAAAARDAWAGRFYGLMARWDFLPNSPTLMNAGRPLQQLSACFVLPVPDSLDGIMMAASAAAAIQKSGGGTGFSFSRLRPAGAAVRGTSGAASGALSFLKLFDALTATIKQGGTRRGANMAVLRCDHPEVLDFIRLKREPGALENFNLSVGVDAAFMRAVAEDASYDLRDPRDGRPTGRVRARAVFDAMVECAWATGDPGLVVLDRINASGSNPTPALGDIEATNPCGEQPLLPWEPCNLGSLNLARFVAGEPFRAAFDFARLRVAAAESLRFLDDAIEVNDYPLAECEALAKGNRRVGLGVMGWAEALALCGVRYDAPEALELAERVMACVNDAARDASVALARERGVFPNWSGSVYDPASPHFRGVELRPRHCARTTVAPTGTIAIAAGLQGGGIEPFFALSYTRYNARALEAAAAGRVPDEADIYREESPLITGAAAAGRESVLVCAHEIPVEAHVRMQAAFQRHTDNGVSKTVNLRADATTDDVRRAYLLAYELGCKGVTVYRDGCKGRQVLNLGDGGCGRATCS
ncbi:MAG: adenosylcobalamin-dependent ribonucleoside-diphosphate reductase [Elusimicrobiota bacterium]|nr:adenosylcobalamin-dependent ribonucleoside-diphosphate reductase [Elusimicrobiota bacterium]